MALEAFSIAAATFSIALAMFAIWLASQQRKESQTNYTNTKDALSKIEKVMEKTELLVSENFQNLLKSVTEQQGKMLESFKPRQTAEDKYADLLIKLADEPDKLNEVIDAISKMSVARQKQVGSGDLLQQLINLGMKQQDQKDS